MRKFILVPDSFKGTLSSRKVCEIMAERIKEHFPESSICSIPVADGGEGSVECFLTAIGGEKVTVKCKNPYFEEIQGFYGIMNGGNTAIVEMAAAAGLPLVEDRKNPMLTTTYGVGEIVKDILTHDVKEIVIGLGGSATNDFGCGFAAALGVRFFDDKGDVFIPVGATLKDVAFIDLSNIDSRLNSIKLTIMCDVDNPPYGDYGAARVFAEQKAANIQMIEMLDEGVKHLCDIIKRDIKLDLSNLNGGGAAGAMACGLVAFFGAELKMGIDAVLDTVNFNNLIDNKCLIFTGEGRLDSQSLRGKVISGISARAKAKGVPVIAVVGGIEGDISKAYDMGINSVFTINRRPEDFALSRYKSEENLRYTMDNILRLMKI